MSDLEKKEDVQMDHSSLEQPEVADHHLQGKLGIKQEHADLYAEALAKYGAPGSIDPEVERRLVRKLDWTLLPLLGICYFFYYVDKTTLSYAAIFGIKTDLNLSGLEYSWLSSIFYFGWLAWAIPSNLLMQLSPPAYYLGFNILMWGVLLMAQTAANNFAALAALRVLSGCFEAIADPAFMMFTTMYYKRSEQPAKIAVWYAFNGLGQGGGGLIGFGIGQIKGKLQTWRYEFLIVGAVCSLWGIVLLLLLQNSPATNRWLTHDERLMAIARVAGNQTGVENRKIKRDQLIEFFLDYKTYMWMLLGFLANVPNGGISNFSTLVIQGLGFNTLQTSLLNMPQGAFVVIWILTGGYLNHKFHNRRCLVALVYMVPTIAGSLAFLLAPQKAYVGRLICYYLTSSYQSSMVSMLSILTSNTGGQTKKMLTSGVVWFGACIGNISGPFFWHADQAPSYHEGIGSILVCNCLEVLLIIAFWACFKWENRKKEKAAEGKSALDSHATTFSDLTDKQNPNFRYVY